MVDEICLVLDVRSDVNAGLDNVGIFSFLCAVVIVVGRNILRNFRIIIVVVVVV
jgi:hypothetical protein